MGKADQSETWTDKPPKVISGFRGLSVSGVSGQGALLADIARTEVTDRAVCLHAECVCPETTSSAFFCPSCYTYIPIKYTSCWKKPCDIAGCSWEIFMPLCNRIRIAIRIPLYIIVQIIGGTCKIFPDYYQYQIFATYRHLYNSVL